MFQHTTETNFFLHITASNDFTVILPIRINSGVALGSASNFVATGLPLGIPDLGTADSTLNVSGMSLPLGKVKVAVHLQHTYDADLVLHLIGPDGTDTTLAAHAGANGQNYGIDCENSTEFSDDASVELVSAEPPFIGTYRPLETLSVFNGKSGAAVNGYWSLRVADEAAADVGSIQCWSLALFPKVFADGLGQCLFPPEIVVAPTNTIALAGAFVSMSVQAHGSEPFTYEWRYNETNVIAEATNATLVLANVATDQAGTYQVVVGNGYGSVTSSPALLSIVVPPAIACGTDRVVSVGSEWDFDVPAITGSNPVLSVESTLTNQVCGENYNIIRAWKVSDETGLEAFCTQTISVRNPELPEIVFQPESQSVLLGATIHLEVEVSNCFAPTYQWYFNETNELAEATNATFIISNVTLLQSGNYAVLVVNDYGSVTSSPAVLEVHVPAFIEGEPTNTLVISGQTAEFSVTASGDQPLTYQWYFNQSQLIAEGTNATLGPENVNLTEAGSYVVAVANTYGNVTSTPALLTVRIPPFIISAPTNVSVLLGQSAQFAVIAGGDEPFTYEWLYNETNVVAEATNATLVLTNVAMEQRETTR